MPAFQLSSKYTPQGDQAQAIAKLTKSISAGNRHQTLLGVTGSGKTFTAANVIREIERPTLVISHNKTLAAQLYSEFKQFFPDNAVEYFVSYFDYYQPEAYIPRTDTYIEKDSSINEEIERLRLSTTSSLLSRRDVIVVASVSCIYGLALAGGFSLNMLLTLKVGQKIDARDGAQRSSWTCSTSGTTSPSSAATSACAATWSRCIRRTRTRGDPHRVLRRRGRSHHALRSAHRACERAAHDDRRSIPAKQFVTPQRQAAHRAGDDPRGDARSASSFSKSTGSCSRRSASRMRTEYDLEMMQEMGFCSGIENYSRHLSGRPPGSRPYTLLDFFPRDFLLVVDESHATIPQIGGMYEGDASRKNDARRIRLPPAERAGQPAAEIPRVHGDDRPDDLHQRDAGGVRDPEQRRRQHEVSAREPHAVWRRD